MAQRRPMVSGTNMEHFEERDIEAMRYVVMEVAA